uniref:T cell receptor alpha variable 26-2 n=1 Tax=Oryctolagus cuniculus TaxID=9986 RepID=A0A5F9CWT5_RABIT
MRLVAGVIVLLTSGIMADAKTTQPTSMETTEGDPVHLPCNHSTISGSEYIYWYRQIPLQGPEYVIYGVKNNVTNGGASLTIAADRKFSTLILPHITLRDAAVYYCIVRDTHWGRWGCSCTISHHLKSLLRKNELRLNRRIGKVKKKKKKR